VAIQIGSFQRLHALPAAGAFHDLKRKRPLADRFLNDARPVQWVSSNDGDGRWICDSPLLHSEQSHSSDDRPMQYRGKHSRHSRGQALTNSRRRKGTAWSEDVKKGNRSANVGAVAPMGQRSSCGQ